MKKEEVGKEKRKRLSALGAAFMKLSVFFFTIFLVAVFPQIISDLEDWKWAFLVISILFAIYPIKEYFEK
ncbi:MAG: hypothetical protein QXG18_02385 [Candidatus Pacearchaeota archaeon]